MVAATFPKALQLVLAHEGGWSDHPADPGGATMKGVTQAVYDAYRHNKGLSSKSVRNITTAELNAIYEAQYWDRANCDRLPAGIDYAVFDYSVNSGVQRAVKDIQRTVGVAADGIMGAMTVRAIVNFAKSDEEKLIADYCNRRMKFLKSLKTWGTFGKGWSRRVIGNVSGAQDNDIGVIDYATKIARNDLKYTKAGRIAPKELPKAIGKHKGELSGKGEERDQSLLRTPEGAGATMFSSGTGGELLTSQAQELTPHFSDTIFGKIVIVAFILLIVAGAALWAYGFYKRIKEKVG